MLLLINWNGTINLWTIALLHCSRLMNWELLLNNPQNDRLTHDHVTHFKLLLPITGNGARLGILPLSNLTRVKRSMTLHLNDKMDTTNPWTTLSEPTMETMIQWHPAEARLIRHLASTDSILGLYHPAHPAQPVTLQVSGKCWLTRDLDYSHHLTIMPRLKAYHQGLLTRVSRPQGAQDHSTDQPSNRTTQPMTASSA